MEELVRMMSREDLDSLKAKYANNESVIALVNGIFEAREREEREIAEAKAKAEAKALAMAKFDAILVKVAKAMPTPPEGVHNVFFGWIEAEEDGVKGYKWQTTTEHVCRVSQVPTTEGGNPGKAKVHAIRAFQKLEGAQLQILGNFRSCEEFAQSIGLDTKGGSARKAVEGLGKYFLEPYTGSEFTIKR